MTRLAPAAISWSSKICRNGRPEIGAMGFGRFINLELSRVPKPPARMIASIDPKFLSAFCNISTNVAHYKT
jgi:hypothetical protein